MTERKRRKYSREFKEEAVKLVTEQGYRVSEAARNLGIRASMLGRWERDNEQLRMEREILKKAAAFFAKESE